MSRIGKQPIVVPQGVELQVTEGVIVVKGPKGELSQKVHPWVLVEKNYDGVWLVTVKKPDEKTQRSLWGLYRRLIENMLVWVTQGFSKKLEINGVGYKFNLQDKKLVLNVGFSHPVEYHLPVGVIAEGNNHEITISGADKQQVGEVAAQIRSIRKPEPYKGKGIKYSDEVVRRKAGKSAAKA